MGCCYSRAQSTVNWEEYLDDAQTGDIILWSSSGLEAKLVRLMTNSYYSHVGIVLKLSRPIREGESGVYLYHSPSSKIGGIPDQFSSPPVEKEGPQLNDLRSLLRKFKHEKSIEVRRLRYNESATHPWRSGVLDVDSDSTVAFAKKEHSKLYERDTVELFDAAYDGPGGLNKENLKYYFCSELVAQVMKEADMLKTDLTSNEFVPENFSSGDDRGIPLAAGFHYERERKLVFGRTMRAPSMAVSHANAASFASGVDCDPSANALSFSVPGSFVPLQQ